MPRGSDAKYNRKLLLELVDPGTRWEVAAPPPDRCRGPSGRDEPPGGHPHRGRHGHTARGLLGGGQTRKAHKIPQGNNALSPHGEPQKAGGALWVNESAHPGAIVNMLAPAARSAAAAHLADVHGQNQQGQRAEDGRNVIHLLQIMEGIEPMTENR